jgi:hypothetical protein
MDWSLLQPNANKSFLRDVRGYKNPYYYYIAMILDPILRFNWIFYSIYTSNIQHSSLVSFLVGFSEVSRRGMWTLFRVENEHCSNVALFKAFRDVPLPYKIESSPEESSDRQARVGYDGITGTTESSSSSALSPHRTPTSGHLEAQVSPNDGMRRRALTSTFTSILANAHTQDFEKKRKVGPGGGDNVANLKSDGLHYYEDDRAGSTDEEDNEQNTQDILDAEALVRGRRTRDGEGRDT